MDGPDPVEVGAGHQDFDPEDLEPLRVVGVVDPVSLGVHRLGHDLDVGPPVGGGWRNGDGGSDVEGQYVAVGAVSYPVPQLVDPRGVGVEPCPILIMRPDVPQVAGLNEA